MSTDLFESFDETFELGAAHFEVLAAGDEAEVVGAAVFAKNDDVELDRYAVELGKNVGSQRFAPVECQVLARNFFDDFDVEHQVVREHFEWNVSGGVAPVTLTGSERNP